MKFAVRSLKIDFKASFVSRRWIFLIQIRIGSRLNIFKLVIKLISELTAKDAKDNDKANFKNNQSA